jgi:cell division transport system ATP-binding protein
MIQISHLYKTYPGPVHALRDLELKIEKGEFVFLTGSSGAGKTTLFRMICAFDKPTSGSLKVADRDMSTISSKEASLLRRKIGVVFQDFRLLKDRTVFENTSLPLEILGERRLYIQNRVNEMLENVGLKFKGHCYPDQLSGGEQQRVAIARALIHHPGLLIADEPTGNLDPELSLEIMDVLKTVNAQGTTVFVATHDFNIVEKSNARRIEISEGSIKSYA